MSSAETYPSPDYGEQRDGPDDLSASTSKQSERLLNPMGSENGSQQNSIPLSQQTPTSSYLPCPRDRRACADYAWAPQESPRPPEPAVTAASPRRPFAPRRRPARQTKY